MKRPSFQFYPADWRKDPALSSCSLGARGLWIEMMCVAHESDEYGVLTMNGKPMTEVHIARQVGESPTAIRRFLQELEAAGVFSRNEAGAIFSRRMVKDERIRTVRAAAGQAGWEAKGGNRVSGRFAKAKIEQHETSSGNLLKQNTQQNTALSSSSSSSEVPPVVPLAGGRRKARTPAPDAFDVGEGLWAWAVGIGVSEDRIEPETAQFLERAKAKDERYADWPMAWKNWMRNSVKFGRKSA